MGRPPQKLDAKAFSERLNCALEAKGTLFPPMSEGLQAAVAKHFKVSSQSATAWLQGKALPTPDKVLELANVLQQDFMWLYFGIRQSKGGKGGAPPAYQSMRPDPETLEAAMTLLEELDGVLGRKHNPRPNADALAAAYTIVLEGGPTAVFNGKSNLFRIAEWSRDWEKKQKALKPRRSKSFATFRTRRH